MIGDDDDGPRDENGDRLPVDEDKRSGGGTLADILAETQRLTGAAHEMLERRAKELTEHKTTCRAEECRTCERVKCARCEKIKQGLTGLCEACRDREQFERAKLRVFASIPKRFRWAIDAELSELAGRVSFPPDRISGALAWATNVADAPPSLLLNGVTGSGKTSLVVALFAAWFARARNEGARFVSALELGLARSRFPLGHDDPPAVTIAIAAPLLILDDLGAEAAMHKDVIAQVLHSRHNEDRPTWVTTGLTHVELGSRYDGGVVRRILEQAKQVTLVPVSLAPT